MYCSENYISCSIIYALNISGLILVTAIFFKNKEYYFREWKRIRQVIKDYNIDYKNQVNMPIFVKFLGILSGFFSLIIASIVSIIMWDMSFGFMEIANIFLWALCAFLFYVDYRSSFKFSRQLRIALAVILAIQLTSGIIFGLERQFEEENTGIDNLYVETSVYLFNFVVMLIINVFSIFFPTFNYEKVNKNNDDHNFISFNTLQQQLIQDEPIKQSNSIHSNSKNNSRRQSFVTPSRTKSSFLDQLDDLTKENQNEPQISSLQKLKEEQQILYDPNYGLTKEDEAIQKEKEQKDLMEEIINMHKQLDEKLNKLKPKQEQQNSKQESQTDIKDQIDQQQPESIIIKEQQSPKSGYEVTQIKVDGFQEIKKQGKRQIYFNIFYFSNSKQKQVRTEHTLKEFAQLRQTLINEFSDKKFPEIPERKPNERLTGKEVSQRGQQLEQFLQFIEKYQLKSQALTLFFEEIQGPVYVQEEKEGTIEQTLKNKEYNDFFEQRQSTVTSRTQSLYALTSKSESFDVDNNKVL